MPPGQPGVLVPCERHQFGGNGIVRPSVLSGIVESAQKSAQFFAAAEFFGFCCRRSHGCSPPWLFRAAIQDCSVGRITISLIAMWRGFWTM